MVGQALSPGDRAWPTISVKPVFFLVFCLFCLWFCGGFHYSLWTFGFCLVFSKLLQGRGLVRPGSISWRQGLAYHLCETFVFLVFLWFSQWFCYCFHYSLWTLGFCLVFLMLLQGRGLVRADPIVADIFFLFVVWWLFPIVFNGALNPHRVLSNVCVIFHMRNWHAFNNTWIRTRSLIHLSPCAGVSGTSYGIK